MRFGCTATEANGWYGVTLLAAVDDTDVVCYKSVFRSEYGLKPKEVVAIYSDVHQSIMNKVRLPDEISEEMLHGFITKSVELTSSGMGEWGLDPIEFSTVPDWVLFFLFASASEETIH